MSDRKPSSNKQKRAILKQKRSERHRKKLAAEGRLVRGHEIPRGSVAADVSQQSPNNSYSTRYFYIDQPFVCVDCGVEEVWTATQQKWYYEVAKGPIYGRAVRCRNCRARRRRALDKQREHMRKAKSNE